MIKNDKLNNFKKKFELGDINEDLLTEALTTSKYVTKEKIIRIEAKPNRTLAMVGDAVINMVLTSKYFKTNKEVKDIHESRKLKSCNKNLAKIIKVEDIKKYAFSDVDGKLNDTRLYGEEARATLFEAIVGALFESELGLEGAKRLINKYLP
jgi:dsRNA-specific ribonuclease